MLVLFCGFESRTHEVFGFRSRYQGALVTDEADSEELRLAQKILQRLKCHPALKQALHFGHLALGNGPVGTGV